MELTKDDVRTLEEEVQEHLDECSAFNGWKLTARAVSYDPVARNVSIKVDAVAPGGAAKDDVSLSRALMTFRLTDDYRVVSVNGDDVMAKLVKYKRRASKFKWVIETVHGKRFKVHHEYVMTYFRHI